MTNALQTQITEDCVDLLATKLTEDVIIVRGLGNIKMMKTRDLFTDEELAELRRVTNEHRKALLPLEVQSKRLINEHRQIKEDKAKKATEAASLAVHAEEERLVEAVA
ncbi:MAG: hypothetical protein WCP97_00670 [bacterium]